MVARLRTLAGCLNCRRRRKKCGEERPDCERCTRSNLQCLWPDNHRIDGRRRRRQCVDDVMSDAVSSTPPNIRLVGTDDQLPRNFKLLLSLQFLRPKLEDAVDASYIETLCRHSTLARSSVLACTSMSTPSDSTNQAWSLYTTALRKMSTQLSTDTTGECNDDTLTAAVWFCIFESSRFEGGLHVSLHLKALHRLLAHRQPLSHTSTPTNVLSWERICVESFIYLCVVATIVDDSFNADEFMQPIMEQYVSCLRPSVAPGLTTSLDHVFSSPVLGAPPEIFLILVRAIKLARVRGNLTSDVEVSVWKLYTDVHGWELMLDARSAVIEPDRCPWMGKIYATATRVILTHILCTSTLCPDIEHPHRTEWVATVNEAARIVELADYYLERSWTKYILWPLAIIGAVSLSDDKIQKIRKLLQQSGERSSCNTARLIQVVLEQIWSEHLPNSRPDHVSASMNALHTLLSEMTVSKTVESILSPTLTTS